VTLFERIEMRQLQAQILHNLGHVHADSGDLAGARQLQEQALAAARAMNDAQTAGYALERLAVLEVAEGNAAAALERAGAAIEAARHCGDNGLLAISYAALGEAFELAGDRVGSDNAFIDARRIAEAATAMEKRQVLLRQGGVLRRREEFEGAAGCFEAAARIGPGAA
jgi:tetratricopeptide (TPR) repeat protein